MIKAYLLTSIAALGCLFMNAQVMAEAVTEASTETAQVEIIEISTVEELAAVNDRLDASYVLTADLDLGGMEWTPIGSFVPSGEEGEEVEIPDPAYAFTGSFSGDGHTISNYVINQPEGMTLGLFGCIANASINNLTISYADVTGSLMAGDVIGYAYCSTIDGVDLEASTITATTTEMSGEGMYGGIVGAGMNSLITNCNAAAEIVLPDNTGNAGIVGGGLEMTSVRECTATGIIMAGNNCYGLGGVSGCGFGSEEFAFCTADDVTITAGDDCFWIGGITGYTGGYEDESFGVPVTLLSNCAARFVNIETGANPDGVNKIVGSGFFSQEAADMMGAPYDVPTVYTLEECVWEEYVAE